MKTEHLLGKERKHLTHNRVDPKRAANAAGATRPFLVTSCLLYKSFISFESAQSLSVMFTVGNIIVDVCIRD
jgi:hypothetical protein